MDRSDCPSEIWYDDDDGGDIIHVFFIHTTQDDGMVWLLLSSDCSVASICENIRPLYFSWATSSSISSFDHSQSIVPLKPAVFLWGDSHHTEASASAELLNTSSPRLQCG